MAGEAASSESGATGDVGGVAGVPTTPTEQPGDPEPMATPPIGEPAPVEPTTAPPTGDPEPATEEEMRLGRDAFNARIAQAKRSAEAAAVERHKAWLRERYGTDDQSEIDKLIANSKKLQEEAEERRRAEMTELDRFKADLAAERRRREAAERKVLEAERRRRFDKQDAAITRIAGGHVDADLVEDAALLFARHVSTLDADRVKKMSEKDVTKWFADFVKRKPAWKRADNAPPPEKPKPKQPVTTGTPPTGQPEPVPTGTATGKTFKPGQSNSMTKEEVEAYKREKGYTW